MDEKTYCEKTSFPIHNFAVIGHPIAHTMSPFIHSCLFSLAGYGAASYRVMDIAPEDLESFLPRLRELSGFNITIPHKQAIIPYLDDLDKKLPFFTR